MTEDDEEMHPEVPLGSDAPVEGVPVARVAARLHYPLPRSQLLERAGETEIRTPAGPTTVRSVIEETDVQIFPTAAALITTVREKVGEAPVTVD